MRSKAGMDNRQGDGDLRLAQVSVPQLMLWLLAFGLAWQGKYDRQLVLVTRKMAADTSNRANRHFPG